MTRTLKLKHGFSLFLLSFLWGEIAEAKLFRTGGRGTQADVYSESFYYVSNDYINEIGIEPGTNDLGFSYFDQSVIGGTVSQTGGVVGLDAVPSECVNGYSRLDLDEAEAQEYNLQDELSNAQTDEEYAEIEAEIAALYAPFANEPCVWEFEQGEDLFTWGSFDLLFDDSEVEHYVNWKVTGQNNTWDFNGSINELSDLTDPNDPNYQIPIDSVLLNTEAPIDLLPGDYSIEATVFITSEYGKFFYVSDNPGNEIAISEFCQESEEFTRWLAIEHTISGDDYDEWIANNPEPEMEVCGYSSGEVTYDAVYDDLTDPYKRLISPQSYLSFTSPAETLRILASNSQNSPPVNASAPASLSLFLLSLVGGVLRRRYHTINTI